MRGRKTEARSAGNCSVKTKMIKSSFAILSAILFLTAGQSFAQSGGADDAYVAPYRFYAQKLVEDVRAKHPELIYLNLRTIPPDRTGSYKVAMDPPSHGGKSDQADIDAEHGKPLVEQITDAPREFRVLLPLRESTGKIIGNIAVRMKLAEGKTKSDAMKLAEKVDRELQDGIPSKAKLFERI
jgi:hypothetical protein